MDSHNTLYSTIQVIIIYNVLTLGWDIRKVDTRSFELTKKVTNNCTFNLSDFMDNIIKINNIARLIPNVPSSA